MVVCSLTENSSNEVNHQWLQGYCISLEEFELQLRYDLAVWFMFANQYASAQHHLRFVGKLFTSCQQSPMQYCSISAPTLKGFLSACQIQEVEADKSLTERLNESVKNRYVGFLQVLQEDNVRQEVPIHYREMAELDLMSAAITGKVPVTKELVFQVQSLNVIRRTLANRHVPLTYFKQLGEEGSKGLQFLLSVIQLNAVFFCTSMFSLFFI